MSKPGAISAKKKASAVMVALGAESASRIYKYMHDEEIELLTMEIATMKEFSAENMEAVLTEFYNLCLTQKFVTEGGLEYAKEILNKAIGAQGASALIDKVTKSLQTRAFDFLRKVDPQYLLTFIQNEHPQTVALILSFLRPEQASAVLSELPLQMQLEVTERIATMDRTSPEVVKQVEAALEKKLSSVMSVGLSEIGGIKQIAEILNEANRQTEKYILDELGKRDPALTEEIRKRMFVFEDIATLDATSIQRFLRDADTKDLLVALKGTSSEIADAFYSNMSTRMNEMMREDAQYLHGVRLSDVQDAQQRLMGIIRRLEEEGEIFISRGKKDEIID